MVNVDENITEASEARDRCHERVVALSRTGWALEEDRFLQSFDQTALGSRRFIEELIKFSRSEPDFSTAFQLIQEQKILRREGTGVGPGIKVNREWTSSDVVKAMAAREKSTAVPLQEKSVNTQMGPSKRQFPVYQVSCRLCALGTS